MGESKSINTLKHLGKKWNVTNEKKIKTNDFNISCLDMNLSKKIFEQNTVLTSLWLKITKIAKVKVHKNIDNTSFFNKSTMYDKFYFKKI